MERQRCSPQIEIPPEIGAWLEEVDNSLQVDWYLDKILTKYVVLEVEAFLKCTPSHAPLPTGDPRPYTMGGRCFLQSFVSFFYLMDKGAKKSEIVEFCHLTLSKSLLKKKNIIAITLLALTLSKNVPGKIRMNCQKQLTTATQQWLNNGSAIARISDSYYHASSRVKNSATG